jgi:undecaprenyl-phosphate 4-deoxy-4-formamido-L-arabinose transferase
MQLHIGESLDSGFDAAHRPGMTAQGSQHPRQGPFPYIDGLVFQVTQNVGRLQVQHLPRIEGRSNYTLARLFRLWLSMFSNFSVIPLRFATLFGIAFGALGALAAVIVIVEAISDNKPPQGWASLMVAVLVLAGVQLIVVGLIGEYLGRMFLAVNRKPQYLVREVFTRGADGLEVEHPAADTKAAGQPYRQPSTES